MTPRSRSRSVRRTSGRSPSSTGATWGRAWASRARVLNDRTLAEEVVQEVFVRTWRDPSRFDPARGSMRSFLLAQVHGRSVDLLRAEIGAARP